ncbi:MAG TPA: prepilin-type N-terminal cleavage/methylation domain-containing protein [Terriglobales bacterium]|nr:prepilin-type N-terminal cleavage/methylation domain-containing protein [Terriglobales bacterium]
MGRKHFKRRGGFSLIELMIGMLVGLIVLGAAVELFKSGTDVATRATQRSEMQDNVRASLNLIAKDVAMAGSGLPSGGLALPYGGTAVSSQFACPQTGACYVSANTYPDGTVGTTAVSNYMYGLIPGPNNGMQFGSPSATIPATGQIPDSITVVYQDYSFPLNQYTVSFPASPDGTSIIVSAAPAGVPAILDPTGIKVGDLILLSNDTNGGAFAVGEVTGISGGGTIISFANSDPLKINQTAAPQGNIAYLDGISTLTATRIYAVTYFIQESNDGQPPRLMRQVNGQDAVPVADNIIGLKFTYDVCDGSNPNVCAAISDPITSGYSPNNIYKVNIQIMGQSMDLSGKSQSMVLGTSVSTQNLSFTNRYQ